MSICLNQHIADCHVKKKNKEFKNAYCRRALELFIKKKKKKKKKQNIYKYCLKFNYTYHSFIYLKQMS